MAETVARRGGIAVIPQDIPHSVVHDVISWVKSRHPFFDTAITLAPNETVADAISLINKRAHGAIIVVENNKPVGIITEDDCTSVDRFTQLSQVMTKNPFVISDSFNPRQAFDFLHEHRRSVAPVVNASGELVGILTRVGALRATLYTPALDSKGRLRIAAAVGINGDVAAKAKALIDSGVDVLVVVGVTVLVGVTEGVTVFVGVTVGVTVGVDVFVGVTLEVTDGVGVGNGHNPIET
jgi:IMP dehydrogenase